MKTQLQNRKKKVNKIYLYPQIQTFLFNIFHHSCNQE
jgi:hypothetical protein